MYPFYGDVAQLVEQRNIHVLPRVRNPQQILNSTVNPLVCGSSPHVTAFYKIKKDEA